MKLRTVASLVYITLAMLVIRLLLGIVIILYTESPVIFNAAYWNSLIGSVTLLHGAFGVISLLLALYLVTQRERFKLIGLIRRSLVWGLVFVALSLLFGLGFMFTAGSELFALAMAASSTFAILSYTISAAFFLVSS